MLYKSIDWCLYDDSWINGFNGLNEQNEVHRFTNPPLVTSLPPISVAFISQNLYVM